MKKLSLQQIKAADAILEMCDRNGTASPFHIFGIINVNGWEIDEITSAAEFLIVAELIKSVSTRVKDENNFEYMFTDIGEKFYRKGKRTVDYIEAEAEKESEQQRKNVRDEKTKDAQLQKLEAELLVLKDMQTEQRIFWQSGIDRDNRQRWQFWLTLLLAAGGFLLGIINFVKDISLPK